MKTVFWNLSILCALFQITICVSPFSINQRPVNQYQDETSPGADYTGRRRVRQFSSLGEQMGFGPPIGFPSFPSFSGSREPQSAPQEHSEEEYPHHGGYHPNSLGPHSEGPYRGRGPGPYHAPQHGPEYHPQGNQGPYYPPPHSHSGGGSPYQQNFPQRAPSQGQATYKRPYHHDDPKKPIVLKVSRLKSVESHPSHPLPEGPSVFYAPSPDVKYKKDAKNRLRQPARHNNIHHYPMYHQVENNHERHPEEYPAGHYQDPNSHQRYRRETEKAKPSVPAKSDKKNDSLVDPMLADGSEQDNFWDLSSPFIMFDTYKKGNEEEEEEAETSDVSSNQSSGNVTFHDSNSEEQRFFPSFPSPYLGLSPFSSAPARAPLFPGPAANRAPSRYHPSSFGGPKYSQHPNRGPSSAASHERYQDTNLLGSGNFEVVRGGTYYGEEEDSGPSYHHGGGGGSSRPAYHEEEEGYYPHNNGHSSPYRGGGGDFFANFRDFADINPHSRSFSHHHETAASELSSHKKASGSNLLDMSDESRHQPQFSMEYDPMMATF